MNCKDCIHYDVCKEDCAFNNLDIDKATFYKNCYNFKNKADFVEVVRCGDCQYSFYISAKDELECRKHNGCLKYPHDFCSYGERSET